MSKREYRVSLFCEPGRYAGCRFRGHDRLLRGCAVAALHIDRKRAWYWKSHGGCSGRKYANAGSLEKIGHTGVCTKSIFFALSGRGGVLNCLARPTLRYCQIMYRPQHLILSTSQLFDFYFSHKFGALAWIFIIYGCLEIIDALRCAWKCVGQIQWKVSDR